MPSVFKDLDTEWKDLDGNIYQGTIQVARMPNSRRIQLELRDGTDDFEVEMDRSEDGVFVGRWSCVYEETVWSNTVSGRFTKSETGKHFQGIWWENDDADSRYEWSFDLIDGD